MVLGSELLCNSEVSKDRWEELGGGWYSAVSQNPIYKPMLKYPSDAEGEGYFVCPGGINEHDLRHLLKLARGYEEETESVSISERAPRRSSATD